MRRICLTLAVAAFVVSTVQAQGGRGGRPMSSLSLLANKSVQEELKLSDELKKKATDSSEKVQIATRRKYEDAKINPFNPGDKKEEADKIAKEGAEASEKAFGELAKELKPEQEKRLSQIRLQLMGPAAFGTDEVKKGLTLSDDQQKKFKEINETLSTEVREITKDINFRSPREKREEATKKVTEKRTEAMGKIASSLSSEQKKTWKEMTGEKFEIKFEQPRPRGGNGGNGQPRRPRTDLS